MTVNLALPQKTDLKPISGFEMGIAQAGIKKPNRKDLLVMTLAPGSQVAGVFTLNRFCAAPVQVCREHLAHFKVPHGFEFIAELPKTATGKIQKYVLRGGRANIAAQ